VGGVCGRGEMSRVPREGSIHSLTHMYINTFHIEGSRTRTVCGMVLYIACCDVVPCDVC